MDVDDIEAGDCSNDVPDEDDEAIETSRGFNSQESHFGREEFTALKEKANSNSPEEAKWLLNLFIDHSENEKYRCEFLEYLPNIALTFSEGPNNKQMKSLISSHLLPTVVKSLNDPSTKVIQAGVGTLISLLEHGLISHEYFEEEIWPILKTGLNDACVEAVCSTLVLMSKMAPWLGSETTERLLLPSLIETSAEFDGAIRNVSASYYGDFCAVVSTEATETILVPSFLKLCEDSEWLVRKSCAETFTSVSYMVSQETRKDKLAPIFARLLKDVPWVRVAALLSLGSFIITFAEPRIVKLGYDHLGDLVLQHQDGFELKLSSTRLDEGFIQQPSSLLNVEDRRPNSFDRRAAVEEKCWKDDYLVNQIKFKREQRLRNNSSDVDDALPWLQLMFSSRQLTSDPQDGNNNDSQESEDSNRLKEDKDDETDLYNQFNYWRDPLPNIDNDLNNPENNNPDEPTLPPILYSKLVFRDINYLDSDSDTDTDNNPDVVPKDLIVHFVSMSERPTSLMYDLAQHCAYNLPAVAMTLGPKNWNLIKPACKLLATDNQWKVRKIVASSIHELAEIVGEEVATRDLVPIFKGFIKDLDEVRIGALKHLAQFLKLLKPAGRASFLPRLTKFLNTDYKWNWRFRQELADQLLKILGLFSPADTYHHLSPVVMSLLLDRVAEVRKAALHLVTELVSHVSIDVHLLRSLLAELAQKFAHSPVWNQRQTFALFCSKLVSESVLSGELFVRDVLPHLLDLSWDRVPNVRLTVARALTCDIMANSYFSDCTNSHFELLTVVIKRLQCDRDRDVRFYALQFPKSPDSINQTFVIDSSNEEGSEEGV